LISTVELVEFFGDAQVHDDKDPGAACAGSGKFVGDAFLHPYGAGADLDGCVDDFRDEFRAAENVHDVDLIRDVFEAGVAFFAKDR
jgi:hypothetical protein